MLSLQHGLALRKAWAPLTFTDETPPTRDNPVAPAQRSPAAQAKAATKHDATGNPVRGFRDLLEHLATLTRDRIRYTRTPDMGAGLVGQLSVVSC